MLSVLNIRRKGLVTLWKRLLVNNLLCQPKSLYTVSYKFILSTQTDTGFKTCISISSGSTLGEHNNRKILLHHIVGHPAEEATTTSFAGC